eukprot:GHVS01025952.1.p1 GENE.GHVS01025952.1~~GHVS01025952.1.p1  ORF type:complete len:100 (-),score=26.90 GHVS01025952.1:124-423(-)
MQSGGGWHSSFQQPSVHSFTNPLSASPAGSPPPLAFHRPVPCPPEHQTVVPGSGSLCATGSSGMFATPLPLAPSSSSAGPDPSSLSLYAAAAAAVVQLF